MTRRVVVTGIGAVTPHGDLAQSRAAVAEGRSAIRPVTTFDAGSFKQSLGGECTTFDPRPWFRSAKTLKLTDRRTRLGVAAAGMAVADAALDAAAIESAGVVIGTSGSDLQTEDVGRALGGAREGDARDVDYFGGRVLRRLNPLWLLVNLANMASAHIAIQLGAHGPNSTITTDWIAGLQAIGEASRWIAGGESDVVIAGAADCGVLPFVFASFEESGFFEGGEPRFVPSEGAAAFVLEELEHARRRGARIVAEVVGYASTQGDLATAARRSLHESNTKRDDVDLVCDAAVFTPRHRELDDAAAAALFAGAPPRFECISLLGHALAAASPIALAIAAARQPRQTLLVNSVGAFGQAASLVMRGVHA
jgi:3-oxoacyl-[acyl-carrier-protein] synthase II